MLRKRTNGLSTKEKTLETNGKLSKTYEIRCGAQKGCGSSALHSEEVMILD